MSHSGEVVTWVLVAQGSEDPNRKKKADVIIIVC